MTSFLMGGRTASLADHFMYVRSPNGEMGNGTAGHGVYSAADIIKLMNMVLADTSLHGNANALADFFYSVLMKKSGARRGAVPLKEHFHTTIAPQIPPAVAAIIVKRAAEYKAYLQASMRLQRHKRVMLDVILGALPQPAAPAAAGKGRHAAVQL